MTDFKALYEVKCKDMDELNDQMQYWQDQSKSLIDEIENENTFLRNRCETVTHELETIKEKTKQRIMGLEKELDFVKKERSELKETFEETQRRVIQFQNIQEAMESELRASNAMLCDYRERNEKTMEQLAMLQLEMEENNSAKQEQLARLKGKLRETEEQLHAIHLKHQRHNDQAESRRSRISSSRLSQTEAFSRESRVLEHSVGQENITNQMSVVGNFRKSKSPTFSRTINLVTNLINQLETKANKIKGVQREEARVAQN